ncbi:SMI1/KNR4 family protein [Catellatospora sichuanensis]|uniref:SMI1/KNR4 family protein n=1 Tax=Catellatospora sichuanensis TaxID=1969805 RepID=UPI001183F3A6|nr:SMI1/KNR4 family protein [Catellatospora sichuanensis]
MSGDPIAQRLDEIAVNLKHLRDRGLPGKGADWHASRYVFGADGHDWRVLPVAADELDELEAALGVVLPAEFRAYLLRFGARQGPVYGLFGPRQIVAEARGWCDDPDDLSQLARPFPFTAGCGVAPEEALAGLPDGSIAIAERGCEFFTVVAVTGPLAGTVWDNDYVDGRYGFWPARAEVGGRSLPRPAQPVGFLDWVHTWTEDALAKTAPQPEVPRRGLRALLRRSR